MTKKQVDRYISNREVVAVTFPGYRCADAVGQFIRRRDDIAFMQLREGGVAAYECREMVLATLDNQQTA